jgi:hypothetical protein
MSLFVASCCVELLKKLALNLLKGRRKCNFANSLAIWPQIDVRQIIIITDIPENERNIGKNWQCDRYYHSAD